MLMDQFSTKFFNMKVDRGEGSYQNLSSCSLLLIQIEDQAKD